MDKYDKKTRSAMMAGIRSKWTYPERRLHGFLKSRKVKHVMHPRLPGKPDILLKDKKVVIFIDSCFFHKCPRCFVMPKSNRGYWKTKIRRNVTRDHINTKMLQGSGWVVLRLWEHEVNNKIEYCVNKILERLSGSKKHY